MVGLEVVDLFAEDEHPKVFAEEFDGVEGICEAGAVEGEPVRVGVSMLSCIMDWNAES